MALVINASDISPKTLSRLAQRKTIAGRNLMITRYEAKAGAEFEAHSHREEQMGYVISGRIQFFVGEGEKPVVFQAGTFFRFAPHERHSSVVLEDAIVIDVFSPPRPEYVAEAVQAEEAE